MSQLKSYNNKTFGYIKEYEIINSIQEIKVTEPFDFDTYSGYEITTNKQKIKLLIDNDQSCCEDFGYFLSEDTLEDFYGSKLINIILVDTCLKPRAILENLDSGNAIFVNIETNIGTLQFVAYNAHNGYYGHAVKIECKQISHKIVI